MKIVLNAPKANKKVIDVAKRLKRLLKGHQLYATESIYRKVGLKKSGLSGDVIFAIGGDGTILGTERGLKSEIPILGISAGTVGFLSEVSEDKIERAVKRFLKGKYHVEERVKLQPILGKKRLVSALNEVVVVGKKAAEICKLEVSVDGKEYKKFDADGVIVATPTGSTAYSLSAGGPIVDPASKTFVIVPICPYTLAARPLVVPDTSSIEIRVLEGKTIIAIDGQTRMPFPRKGRLIIKKHIKHAKLIRFGETFYKELSALVR